jgi:hypothetical protein
MASGPRLRQENGLNRVTLFSALLWVPSLLGASVATPEPTTVTDRTFTVGSSGTLVVRADLGSVAVVGGPGGEVRVHAERTVKADAGPVHLDELEIRMEPSADGLTVRVVYPHEVPGDGKQVRRKRVARLAGSQRRPRSR